MIVTHSKCSGSQVVRLSEDEARLLMQTDGQTTDSVSAFATLLSLPEGDRPLLWVSFHVDVSTASESGDQVSMITQSRLKAGWELVTQLDTDPTARPTDVRCQFTPQVPVDPSTGLVTGQLVMTVGGSLLADIEDMQLAEQWLTGVRRRGEFALYLGPLNVHRWTNGLDVDAIERTVRAGQLVGCLAELEFTTG
ncbi:hypothetical protein ACGFIF_42935 [Kribbella sp. NPDC049174]|uniref:hypothetical protein n=1 Tax=Kribbella sp. NPDC049174 TaxID=3364112 RepID=UPI00371BE703